MDVNELHNKLSGSNCESISHWQGILRDVETSTVALFAVSNPRKGQSARLAGTGTLVEFGGSQYILTAGHVWEECCRKPPGGQRPVEFAISRITNINHSFPIEIQAINASGPPKPSSWSEWGPDLVLLLVPLYFTSKIKAQQVFHELISDGTTAIKSDHIETWWIAGTPDAFGTSTQTNLINEIRLFPAEVSVIHTRDGFDYLDVKAYLSCPGELKSFGGVSGGGLWKVLAYWEPSVGRIESVTTMEGVAFYELTVEVDYGTIRCHGPESIRAIAGLVQT